eukprot:Trichotokara_eunicae@DN4965_c0_g1_i10.p1
MKFSIPFQTALECRGTYCPALERYLFVRGTRESTSDKFIIPHSGWDDWCPVGCVGSDRCFESGGACEREMIEPDSCEVPPQVMTMEEIDC